MKQRLPENCLPSPDLLPELVFALPELQYPQRLNACRELLEPNLEEQRRSRAAIYHQGRVVSFEELAERVEAFAASLLDLGLVAGDRVLLRFWNQPEFIVAWLAVLRVGGIAVATMPLLRARELASILRDCQPAFAVTQEDLWEEMEKALPAHPPAQIIYRGTKRTGTVNWDEVTGRPQKCPPAETEAENLALLAYTSGSTGEPKGTIHTHRDVLAMADSYARNILAPAPEDIFAGTPPLAFTFGLGGLLVFPFRFGAATSLLERFSPPALVNVIRETAATILFCSATAYNMILNAEVPGMADSCRSLRLCVSAGETLPPTVFTAWKQKLGVEILDGIGSTEMLHIFISNRSGAARPRCRATALSPWPCNSRVEKS